IETLMPEVREYEPHSALDGKEDGLFFYRKIIERAEDYLAGGGELFFEIGYDQAADVKAMLEDAGYAEVEVVKDFAGLDRVVRGILNKSAV
ncbi:MAG: peptide chain release factor N(5)-glutamine methyltransferase, partial [Lachnospiraceae bacterium]|nr:peptide chain release factor N(5)-glutamine methyltransferase [Lachnospiraceae bacterium]